MQKQEIINTLSFKSKYGLQNKEKVNKRKKYEKKLMQGITTDSGNTIRRFFWNFSIVKPYN